MKQIRLASAVRKVLGYLVFSLAVVFLAASLYRNWGELGSYPVHVHYGFAFLALAFFAGFFVTQALAWRWIVQLLQSNLPPAQALAIWFKSSVMRYLPGTVWYLGGRLTLAIAAGVKAPVAATSLVLEFAMLISGVGLAFVVTIPLWERFQIGNVLNLSLFFVPLALALCYPGVLNPLANSILRRIGPRLQVEPIALTFPGAAGTLALYLLVGLLHGLGTLLTLLALSQGSWAQAPFVVGASALAWLVGTLTPVAPAGLGVREGALAALLSLQVPASVAVVVAVLSRVLVTLAELLCVIVVLAATRLLQKVNAAPQ